MWPSAINIFKSQNCTFSHTKKFKKLECIAPDASTSWLLYIDQNDKNFSNSLLCHQFCKTTFAPLCLKESKCNLFGTHRMNYCINFLALTSLI